ncbi:MAG TPA: ketoacyl-ACP synthase III [Firmicutes bacterium]|nr:ketoacyl-ACP synthase III [Bacillota bacterium]
MRSVGVTAVGAAVPQRILTNEQLSNMVETSEEWIVRRTGIRERRIADPGTATSDLAVLAAGRALARGDLGPEEVDLILVATSTPDQLMPSTACFVQHALGAPQAAALDVNAACSGFTYAVAVGGQFIKAGTYDTVLVIGADLMSRVIDWQDRASCVLFGDGAGAVVLRATSSPSPFHSLLGADGSGAGLLEIPAGGSRRPADLETVQGGQHTLRMQGREVFRFGVEVLVKSLLEALDQAGLDVNDLALVVPHQANLRIIESAAERLQLPKARFCVNLDHYGNTSAASIPLALEEAHSQGRVRPGDILAFVGFGAGLTWGVNLVTWQGD